MTEQTESSDGKPEADAKENEPGDGEPASDQDLDDQQDIAEEHGGVTIALDAMGGDNAPGAIIEGAIQATSSIDNVKIILVGDELEITEQLEKHPATGKLSIQHAPESIGMDEGPAVALRRKKQSSIHIGLRLVKDGSANAFISAGNTGAVMAVATLILRTIKGIDRPAIAVTLPSQRGDTVLLDAGANVACRASHLFQFGIMGSIYSEYVLGAALPRVGLLSIGEEDVKGNDVTREALELLTKSSLNFIGNTEAKLLYKGAADVVVCDGFTGNIALKISESLAEMMGVFLKAMFKENWRTKLGYLLLKPQLAVFKKKIDHSEVGGAPLLGIDGAVFISHGSSGPKSIRSAVAGARKFVQEKVNEHISESLVENEDIIAEKMGRSDGIWHQMKQKIGLRGTDKENPEDD